MRAYGTVAAFLLLAGMVSTGIYALGALLGPRQGSAEGGPPFESGAAPAMHAWNRYHIRYYAFALLFLAFDMEMVFMYPWAVAFLDLGLKGFLEMFMFIGVLLLGVLYGWREKAFEWS